MNIEKEIAEQLDERCDLVEWRRMMQARSDGLMDSAVFDECGQLLEK